MLILLIILLIIAAIVIIAKASKRKGGISDDPAQRAGKRGERIATDVIESVLREDDHLFTNVQITFEDKPAELDNVIVNKYGVFIIEVKNYKGRLYGDEDDYEWSKYKTTGAGNTYGKTVKNPIKQVKRQTYILARYLEYYGHDVWVEGRAFLLNRNSPVKSEYMLESVGDIDRTIHTFGRNRLNADTVDAVCRLIS